MKPNILTLSAVGTLGIILISISTCRWYSSSSQSSKEFVKVDTLPLNFKDTTSVLYDQSSIPKSLADSLLLQASKFLESAHFDSVIIYATDAQRAFRATDNNKGIIESINIHADALDRAGKYQEALLLVSQYFVTAKNLPPKHQLQTALLYHRSAIIHQHLGLYEEALAEYESALRIYNDHDLKATIHYARTINNIGVIHASKGYFEKALEYYLEALATRKILLGETHRDIAQNYNNIGVLYKNIGDLEQALQYHERALSIRQEILRSNHPEIGDSYYNIGVVLGMMDTPQSALIFHKKSLNIWKNSLKNNHRLIQFALSAIGIDYRLNNDLSRALEYEKEALKLISSDSQIDLDLSGKSFKNIGEIHILNKDYTQARSLLIESLEKFKSAWGNRHQRVAEAYNTLSKLELDVKDYNRSLQYIAKALTANSNSTITANTDEYNINRYFSTAELLSTLSLQAQIYINLSHEERGQVSINNAKNALDIFQLMTNVIQQYRRSFEAEESKLFLAKKASETYSRAIAISTYLYQQTREYKYLEYAFTFMEKGKASILLDALYEADARRFSQIPDSLLAYERQLRIDLTFYDRKLKSNQLNASKTDSLQLAGWNSKFFNLQQSYIVLMDSLEANYVDYFNLKYRSYTASLKDIRQNVLDRDEALIEYYIGPDSLYILAITDEEVRLSHAAHDSLLEEEIQAFRNTIYKRDRAGFGQLGYTLYSKLLLPVFDSIDDKKNWTIVPHGILNYLPFEALINKPTSEEAYYINLPYVIRDHTVRYAYSSTIEVAQHKKRLTSAQDSTFIWSHDFAGFAPVFEDGISRDMLTSEVLSGQSRGPTPIQFNLDDELFTWPPEDSLKKEDDARRKRIDSLVFASPYPWGYLPNTRREIAEIRNLFKKTYNWKERFFGDRAMVFLEKDATEATIKSIDLSRHRFVHIATHAVINESVPELSGIIMAQDSTDDEDDVLHLGEIYNLELNAELVTLSACDTGLGQLARGEGIIGLTRGFMYAGAQSLLVSLWKVEDSSTRQLMLRFYRHVLDGVPKAEAARRAKLEVMDMNPVYSIPYYWAGFILVGE